MIYIKRAHNLGKEGARKIAEQIVAGLTHDLKQCCQWQGDSVQVRYSGAKGSVIVSESKVEVRVELPFLLRPFRARVEREILEQMDKYLGA